MSWQVSRFPVTTVVALLLVACGESGSGQLQPPRQADTYEYSVPADIGDGWAVANLADEGLDTGYIVSMMDRVVSGAFPGIDSVAIAKNGKLVLYWFGDRALDDFDDWVGNTDTERHTLHSTSKSFTSALVGIAIDQGYIASTQVGFYGLFNYSWYDNWDPRKADMTLEHALTMQLGLEWDEWSLPYTDPGNDLVALNTNTRDWAKALLDLPMVSDPGSSFTYNTAATNAIAQALENAVGMPLADFANINLFFPMQINDARWAKTPTDLPIGGSGLFLKTRDLLKFGQLYLNNGNWMGQQLISADWIADTVIRRVDIASWATYSEAYGFQWWLDDLSFQGQLVDTWVTAGYGGQYLFVIPSVDLVVAFTGHNYTTGVGSENLYTMLQAYILGAID